MSIAFDCDGERIRLHLSQEGGFSFLFLNHFSETYTLGNPGKKMLFEPDDRLLPWIVGQMAMAYVENDYQELLEEVDEEQQIYIAAGFCLRESSENEEILSAFEDLEEVVYPQLKEHLQNNWKEAEMRRSRIRENYSAEELYRIRLKVESGVELHLQHRGFAGDGMPKFTGELKNELEIWALHHPEHVPI